MGHMKKLVGLTVLAASIALVVLGFGASIASAEQPIVGLWLITVKDSGGNLVDSIFSIWTSDGLESDQDMRRFSPVTFVMERGSRSAGAPTGSPIPSSVFRTSIQTEKAPRLPKECGTAPRDTSTTR
jgi:hypothetical protein